MLQLAAWQPQHSSEHGCHTAEIKAKGTIRTRMRVCEAAAVTLARLVRKVSLPFAAPALVRQIASWPGFLVPACSGLASVRHFLSLPEPCYRFD
jgi:hypothetical protein